MRLKTPLPATLHQQIWDLIQTKEAPKDVKQFIVDTVGISFRRAHEYYKHVEEVGCPIPSVPTPPTVLSSDPTIKVCVKDTPITQSETKWKDSLLYDGDYVFNKEDDKYIVYLRSANRHIVVPGDKHRSMLKAYSNWDGNPASINEICRNFEFPRAWFVEYKSIMGWTHDREPISNEDLKDKNPDELVNDMLQQKRFAIFQRFQNEDWKMTQNDASKWREFQAKQLDPFKNFIDNWKAPAIEWLPLSLQVSNPEAKSWFVCGCFDWQIGSKSDPKHMFRQKEWSTNLAKVAIDKFAYQIVNDVATRKQAFKGCEIVLGGDLHHGFHGYTAKGTPLICDTLKEDQFNALFDSLVYFIGTMHQVFDVVNVRAIRGNHDGFDFYPVMKAVEAYYRNIPHIKFHIYTARTALFKVESVLFLLDHGASDAYHKSETPRNTGNGKALESYIQSLLLAHPEELVGTKQHIFVQGDKHHFEQLERNDFEYFMFGALPLGDKYADHLNLHARPRQNCMIINENGVKEVLHYYFD